MTSISTNYGAGVTFDGSQLESTNVEEINIVEPGRHDEPLFDPWAHPDDGITFGATPAGGGGGGNPVTQPETPSTTETNETNETQQAEEVAKKDHRHETKVDNVRPDDKEGPLKNPNKSAETKLEVKVKEQPKFENGRVTNTPTKLEVEISTTYKDLDDRGKPSKETKGKTLEEHENLHKQDLEDYARRNPPPQPQFRENMTEAQYKAEVQRYQAELDAWAERGLKESEAKRDAPSETSSSAPTS